MRSMRRSGISQTMATSTWTALEIHGCKNAAGIEPR